MDLIIFSESQSVQSLNLGAPEPAVVIPSERDESESSANTAGVVLPPANQMEPIAVEQIDFTVHRSG